MKSQPAWRCCLQQGVICNPQTPRESSVISSLLLNVLQAFHETGQVQSVYSLIYNIEGGGKLFTTLCQNPLLFIFILVLNSCLPLTPSRAAPRHSLSLGQVLLPGFGLTDVRTQLCSESVIVKRKTKIIPLF